MLLAIYSVDPNSSTFCGRIFVDGNRKGHFDLLCVSGGILDRGGCLVIAGLQVVRQ